MNDIEKRTVVQELSEKHDEHLDIHGFYDGMSKSDRNNLENMIDSALEHKPETAEIDHIQVRFTEWNLPKVTIWTKNGLDISENRCFEDSYFTNGHRYEFLLDIRPF